MAHVDDGVEVGGAVGAEFEDGLCAGSEEHEQGVMHDVVGVMGHDAQ